MTGRLLVLGDATITMANYKLTGNTTEFGKTITIGPIASTKMLLR